MIKCKICANHTQKGAKHTCSKCETKIIYGVIQEPFLEYCPFYIMTESEKQRRAAIRSLNKKRVKD